MTTKYPRIEKMMAGYINMDAYEITGASDQAGQIRYYTTRVSPKAMKALLVELDAFEQAHNENLTNDFYEEFDFGAEITDASAFFNLVRSEIYSALGVEQAKNTDTLHETIGITATSVALKQFAEIPDSIVEAFTLALQSRFALKDESADDLLRYNIATAVDSIDSASTPCAWELGSAKDFSISRAVWLHSQTEDCMWLLARNNGALASHCFDTMKTGYLHMAHALRRHDHQSDVYVIFLEQLLKQKGFDVNKQESQSHSMSIQAGKTKQFKVFKHG